MSGVGVPYLGSRISLVSKSEIRYEGILYTIDTKESTVALTKVRIFGTEDRPTDRPVAPRDEIYECIIFRGSDIKDLRVSETAKPQHIFSASLPNDPAIVQVFHSAPLQPPCSVPYGQASFSHVCGMPTLQHYPGQVAYSHLPSLFSAGHGSRSGQPSQTSARKSPTTDAGVQVSSGSAVDKDERDDRSSSQETASKSQISDGKQTGSAVQMQRRSSVTSGRQTQRFRGGPRRGMRGRGRGGGMGNRPAEPLKFDSEYDFEQANAEFKELSAKAKSASTDDSGTETLGSADTEEELAYDKDKSFFDNISCEASRVAKGIPRFDWRVERKINVETFGVSLSNAWLRRRRGRGGFRRGSRGRGGGGSDGLRSVDAPKMVTFGTDTLVSVESSESATELSKMEEIPTIEIIVEKEKEWETADSAKEWETVDPVKEE